MVVSEKSMAQLVVEASKQMQDPEYISSQVDQFMNAQPLLAQYVMSFNAELQVEGVVAVLFHASLILEGIERETSRSVPKASNQNLENTTLESLKNSEPHLAEYIVSNLEQGELAQKLLAQIGNSLIQA